MNDQIMRITAKGQLTIPISVRKKINIREGDYIQSPTSSLVFISFTNPNPFLRD
jgi:hypothetical protein